MNMALVKCANCSASMSADAEKCPKCKARNGRKPAKMMACRVCGAMLEKAVHRQYSMSAGGVYKGTTQYTASLVHVPCPRCGEPKPLMRPYDEEHAKLLLGGPAILAAAFWVVAGVRWFSEGPVYDLQSFAVKMVFVTVGSLFVFAIAAGIFAFGIVSIQGLRQLLWRE